LNKKLIIVNGYPRAGKDTFMDYYIQKLDECSVSGIKLSTVDTVKKAAKVFGWNGEKTPKAREMLSELKDFYTKWFDGPLTEILEALKVNDPFLHDGLDVLLVAMREPEEIKRTVDYIKYLKGIDVETHLIRGINEEINHSSHSDAKVLQYDYDLCWYNYSTVEDFKKDIDGYFDYVILK
jgi:hypothetical protein